MKKEKKLNQWQDLLDHHLEVEGLGVADVQGALEGRGHPGVVCQNDQEVADLSDNDTEGPGQSRGRGGHGDGLVGCRGRCRRCGRYPTGDPTGRAAGAGTHGGRHSRGTATRPRAGIRSQVWVKVIFITWYVCNLFYGPEEGNRIL